MSENGGSDDLIAKIKAALGGGGTRDEDDGDDEPRGGKVPYDRFQAVARERAALKRQLGEALSLVERERALRDPVAQRRAVDERHGDVGAALVLARLVHGAHVRVVDRQARAELLQSPQRVDRLGIRFEHRRVVHFDRELAEETLEYEDYDT